MTMEEHILGKLISNYNSFDSVLQKHGVKLPPLEKLAAAHEKCVEDACEGIRESFREHCKEHDAEFLLPVVQQMDDLSYSYDENRADYIIHNTYSFEFGATEICRIEDGDDECPSDSLYISIVRGNDYFVKCFTRDDYLHPEFTDDALLNAMQELLREWNFAPEIVERKRNCSKLAKVLHDWIGMDSHPVFDCLDDPDASFDSCEE